MRALVLLTTTWPEVVVLEHNGHLPWLDEPDEFLREVLNWLERRSLIAPR